jgi:ABC-2 type transport system ATP-binding protein
MPRGATWRVIEYEEKSSVIEVSNLKKSYGPIVALSGVSFSISANEIVGLLGPNGAGKTTIMKILTGYLQPDGGIAKVGGLDVVESALEVQSQIGYLPENAPLYPELTVQSYLGMMANLRHIPEADQRARLSQAIQSVGLETQMTRPIGELSKGYRQRVGLAQAILHRPRLLILDEPTLGLDPTQIVEIRDLIRQLAQESTILFSTHILPEVEALCSRVIILMNGEIKADAKLSELAKTSATVLVLDRDVPRAQAALAALEGVQRASRFETDEGYPAYRLSPARGEDINVRVFQLASREAWPVRELHRDVRTLESVFNELALAA